MLHAVTMHTADGVRTLLLPFALWLGKLREPSTCVWWADRLKKTEDENLVDGKLLSYDYIEAEPSHSKLFV
jgi:hypothetical protein